MKNPHSCPEAKPIILSASFSFSTRDCSAHTDAFQTGEAVGGQIPQGRTCCTERVVADSFRTEAEPSTVPLAAQLRSTLCLMLLPFLGT